MAENKKSFILYADQINLFENLDDAEAGRLIKHIYRYVNDQNPEIPDKITMIAFEPIKQALKRDLVKWEVFRQKQAENGKKGGRPRKPTEPEQSKEKPKNPSLSDETQKSLSVSDSVSDSVNESEREIPPAQFDSPKDYLQKTNSIRLDEIRMNSRLDEKEFEFALTQWSLKIESGDFILDNRLFSSFQKWINSWVVNNRGKVNDSNDIKLKPTTKKVYGPNG